MSVKIRKGDLVEIISGKDLGARGKVLSVHPAENKVVVERANLCYKHTKPRQNRRGGILEVEAPLHISKVMVVSPKDNQPTRVGYRLLDDGKKVRICRRTGEQLDQ